MANTIFTLENIEGMSNRIDIDDLYEKKKKYDIRQLELFKKILNRIHIKIKLLSKQKMNEHSLWFIVPEVIVGYPKYDQPACIAYIIDQLKQNNFKITYYHPNLLFIYWGHYIPNYIRTEIKNKLKINIDEFGNIIPDKNIENDRQTIDYNDIVFKQQKNNITNKTTQNIHKNDKFTNINTYTPTGNLSYNKLLNLNP